MPREVRLPLDVVFKFKVDGADRPVAVRFEHYDGSFLWSTMEVHDKGDAGPHRVGFVREQELLHYLVGPRRLRQVEFEDFWSLWLVPRAGDGRYEPLGSGMPHFVAPRVPPTMPPLAARTGPRSVLADALPLELVTVPFVPQSVRQAPRRSRIVVRPRRRPAKASEPAAKASEPVEKKAVPEDFGEPKKSSNNSSSSRGKAKRPEDKVSEKLELKGAEKGGEVARSAAPGARASAMLKELEEEGGDERLGAALERMLGAQRSALISARGKDASKLPSPLFPAALPAAPAAAPVARSKPKRGGGTRSKGSKAIPKVPQCAFDAFVAWRHSTDRALEAWEAMPENGTRGSSCRAYFRKRYADYCVKHGMPIYDDDEDAPLIEPDLDVKDVPRAPKSPRAEEQPTPLAELPPDAWTQDAVLQYLRRPDRQQTWRNDPALRFIDHKRSMYGGVSFKYRCAFEHPSTRALIQHWLSTTDLWLNPDYRAAVQEWDAAHRDWRCETEEDEERAPTNGPSIMRVLLTDGLADACRALVEKPHARPAHQPSDE